MHTDLYGKAAKNRPEYDTYEGRKDNERCINVIFGRVEDERFAEFYVFYGRVESFLLYPREQSVASFVYGRFHNEKYILRMVARSEGVRRQRVTLIDTPNVDCEIFTSSPKLTSGGMDALFASTSKQKTDGISQYITKLENGQLYTVGTPEGQTGHQLIRLNVYDIHDIKNKEKLSMVEICKVENTIFDIFPQRS